MPTRLYRKRGVREVVVGLNFHERLWAPDNLMESTNVIVKCLLSTSTYGNLVVDAAYPQVPLPGGLAEEASSNARSRARIEFRSALLEALQNRLVDDVLPIPDGVVDWQSETLGSEVDED